jgi:UDP-N-acetylglucosamine 2-epimerase (non-hydrolysing)
MESSKKAIYVIIGTRAQFIKMAPVMYEMKKRNIPYTLIYTAQHRENVAEILEIYGLPQPDKWMYDYDEANTKSSFLRWLLSIFCQAVFKSKFYIPVPGIVLTHGDTFTAWLAALMGKRAGCIVAHVESGLRSFKFFSPFPEEISRLITFQLSDIYFCPDEVAINNLKSYKGIKVNLGANTMLDAVRFALNGSTDTRFEFANNPYALVSIHRFENIFTSRLTDAILPLLKEISKKCHLVITLHPTTRERLRKLNLYDELNALPDITLHERFDFVDWIHLCKNAQFVISDGGSNQEELYYLGIPTLLFRMETERHEGLGENVVLSKFDESVISAFLDNYVKHHHLSRVEMHQPSKTIVKKIYQL